MRTARILGGLPAPVRSEVLRVCSKHALFKLNPLKLPMEKACAEIQSGCADRYSNPIPARLKSWWRGEIRLTPGSLERYRRVLSSNLLLTRLDLIEHSSIDRMKQRLPVGAVDRSNRHALRLLASLRKNRRGLRKFLHAYWSGDGEYLRTHPATLAWYRRHAALLRELWEHGIPFPPANGYTIQVERDPLEILKLGEYAGTCLGVGGLCSDSAVAGVLDANKRVLYARDRRGRVAGRQLVAIADDDRLVCFSVYPLSCPSGLKSQFRQYDTAFAQALGIPLFDPVETEAKPYEIANVLSMYWWDDGSWDFDISW